MYVFMCVFSHSFILEVLTDSDLIKYDILSRTVSEVSQLIVQISDTLRFLATLKGA